MGFSIKLAPGVRVRASSRGLRASVGPRIARVHVGSGRTGISSGVGPVSVYSSLGPRRRGGGRSTVASREREMARQVRAQARQENVERVRTLTDVFQHILELHREEFVAARPPQAPAPTPPDRAALTRQYEDEALAGIGRFRRAERAEAKERAAARASAEADRLRHGAVADQRRAQAELDEGWARLVANDPGTVIATLGDAFEDNEMPAAAVNVVGDELTLMLLVPPLAEVVPEKWPGVSAAGNPTFRKMGKRERSDFYKVFICGHSLLTVREALATAPGVRSVRVAALRSEGTDAYGTARHVCVLAASFERRALDRVAWATADSVQIVNEVSTDRLLQQDGRSGELKPIDLRSEPDLAALIRSIDDGEPLEQPEEPVDAISTPAPSIAAVDEADAAIRHSREELDRIWRSTLSRVERREAMQRSVQTALDTVTRVFGAVCDPAVDAACANGRRGRVGQAALPHVRSATDALKHVTENANGRDTHEFLDDVAAVVEPLRAAAQEMSRL